MKICTKQTVCNGEPKPLSEYRKDMNRPDGHKDACKECVNDYNATRLYWRNNYREEFDRYNFNRKLYTKGAYPYVVYRSFTSFICRKSIMKLSQMTKQDIDEAMGSWLSVGYERGVV